MTAAEARAAHDVAVFAVDRARIDFHRERPGATEAACGDAYRAMQAAAVEVVRAECAEAVPRHARGASGTCARCEGLIRVHEQLAGRVA